MDEEDGFQSKLDADPHDHFTRLVFADWLADREDPRADGYRALGMTRRVPRCTDDGGEVLVGICGLKWYWTKRGSYAALCPYSMLETLPRDWFYLIQLPKLRGVCPPIRDGLDYSRRVVEDAAAWGFRLLPEFRKRDLLEGRLLTVL